jgi:hypothetical protein
VIGPNPAEPTSDPEWCQHQPREFTRLAPALGADVSGLEHKVLVINAPDLTPDHHMVPTVQGLLPGWNR